MVDCCFCFCKQKTAYEMRISDWSSDVCSSDLALVGAACNRTITPRERIREAVGLGIRVTQATRRNIRATASIGAVAVEPQIAWRRQIPEVGEAHFDRHRSLLGTEDRLIELGEGRLQLRHLMALATGDERARRKLAQLADELEPWLRNQRDRKSTRLNSSH